MYDKTLPDTTPPRTSQSFAETGGSSVHMLTAAGFEAIGYWKQTPEGGIRLSGKAPREPGVYAFAVEGDVKYIGLTQTGLHSRMGHYRRGHIGHRTSSRIKARIIDVLSEGREVMVLMATPDATVWNGLPVNTAAGLEAALIRAMKPAWNMLGAVRPTIVVAPDLGADSSRS